MHIKKLIPSVFIFGSLIIGSCSQKTPSADQIIARVGSSYLTKKEVGKLLLEHGSKPPTISTIVTRWINTELLYQAALDKELDRDLRLQNRIHEYSKQLLGSAFLENLSLSGNIVTNDSIKSYYINNKSDFLQPDASAKLYHFIFDEENEAQELVDKLRKPSRNFDRKELFSQYHIDLKTVYKGSLIPVLDNAVFNNRSSKAVLDPIRSNYGFHVIEILDRSKQGSQMGLDEVYDEIYQRLINKYTAQRTLRILDSLKTTLQIELFLENIK
ncbi:peptidylprolyl isomerase [Candidatus Neomarinimicrobiota bacterium]